MNQAQFKSVLGEIQLSTLVVKHDSKRQRIGTPRKTKPDGGAKAQKGGSKLARGGKQAAKSGGGGGGGGSSTLEAGGAGVEGSIAGADGRFELSFEGKFGRGRKSVRELLHGGACVHGNLAPSPVLTLPCFASFWHRQVFHWTANGCTWLGTYRACCHEGQNAVCCPQRRFLLGQLAVFG